MVRFVVFFGVVFASLGAAAAEDTAPLFADDSVLKITIAGPLRGIKRDAERSTDPHPATITLDGETTETHDIMLSARGKSRRIVCDFPPLRVEFNEKPDTPSLFVGQKRLKLVTHCNPGGRNQQYYLLEYTAYKLMNALTPFSLKVRMAEINYVEARTGKRMSQNYGFFIEDDDDAAERNGMKEVNLDDIKLGQLNYEHAGLYAVMQYMISNYDWSIHNPPSDGNCCHNTKLFGADDDATENLVPVPYDFDSSGMVDAPYSAIPDMIPIRSVRTHYYRGHCIYNAEAREAARQIREKTAELDQIVDTVPHLTSSSRKKTKSFLARFYSAIESDERIEKRMLKNCRG